MSGSVHRKGRIVGCCVVNNAQIDAYQYRPQILDESDTSDAEVLNTLREDSSIEFIDHKESMLIEHGELLGRSDVPTAEERGVWVFYPWRRAVLGILGAGAFAEVRFDRNRNKISRAEQNRFRKLTIGVVGLSVGHAVAHTLALEGLCGELRVADFDDISLSNLNRIPGSLFDIGLNKSYVAARRISELDPYLQVKAYKAGISASTIDLFFDGLDIVIEECDSFDVKLAVREAARARRIPVLMETSDRGMLDVERYDLDPTWPVFHGLLAPVDSNTLGSMSTNEKLQFVRRFLEESLMSKRMASSIDVVGKDVSTWPQLGSDVQLGGATVATAVRRLCLGHPLPSGRIRIDIDQSLERISPPITR